VDILHMRDSDFVTSEVTPHNLLLDEADFVRLGPVAKVMPPLRPRTDVDAVQKALSEGTIDIVATDHAPHTPDEKAAGQGDIHKAPGGIAGAQTFLPVMMRLVDDGLLDFARLVEVCAAAPARMFSLFPRKGALDVGSDADFVVVDPKRPMVIRNDNQLSKAAATPFDGLAVSATPVSTYLRGIPIVQDGKVVGRPLGRFLAPVR
jgi:dihydroorotase